MSLHCVLICLVSDKNIAPILNFVYIVFLSFFLNYQQFCCAVPVTVFFPPVCVYVCKHLLVFIELLGAIGYCLITFGKIWPIFVQIYFLPYPL